MVVCKVQSIRRGKKQFVKLNNIICKLEFVKGGKQDNER